MTLGPCKYCGKHCGFDVPFCEKEQQIIDSLRKSKPETPQDTTQMSDTPTSELREAVKRFCRTEQAADNLVAFINDHTAKAVEEKEHQLRADIAYLAGVIEGMTGKPHPYVVDNYPELYPQNTLRTKVNDPEAMKKAMRESIQDQKKF